MKKPDYNDSYYGDYNVLLDSFEHEIVIQVDDIDYQGDSRVLFKDGDKFGILIFGWGSCSGCDALQACETDEEVVSLQRSLYNSIIWRSKEQTLDYFLNHDWKGDFGYGQKENQEFVEKAISYLKDGIS